MRILALDTATASCTAAVVDGNQILAELSLQIPRAHSTRLMPLIDQAVRESGVSKCDLEAVAAGIGPGSFTGLRIGLATAKGIAFALGIPTVGVPTLQSLAYGTGAQIGLVVPMLDAKRGNVYTAVYGAGDRDPATWVELMPPTHMSVEQLAEEIRILRSGLQQTWQFVTLCGDAAEQYADSLKLGESLRMASAGAMLPRAWAVGAVGASLLSQGKGIDPDHLLPAYLRKSEAETLWERRKSKSVQ